MFLPKTLTWAVLAAVGFASAANYHVRKDGTGNSTTINGCVGRLTPGDTLFVHSGTYNESDGPGIPSGTSDALRVTVKAAPGENVTIQASNGQHTILFGGDPAVQSYITIQGFKLTNHRQTANLGFVQGGFRCSAYQRQSPLFAPCGWPKYGNSCAQWRDNWPRSPSENIARL